MENKAALYIAGGAMTGVFGAGVVTTFEKLNVYNKIKAVYGGSCGVFNAAYFLTRQTEMGSTIYYEDLTKDFIYPSRVLYGTLQRFWNGYIKGINKDKIIDAINVKGIPRIIKYKKPLDLSKLVKQKIPFYVKVFNLTDNKVEYMSIKKFDPLKLLISSVCVAPYTFYSEKVNGKNYIDGAVIEPIGLQYFLDKYPNNKIVVVLNQPISLDELFYKNIKRHLKNILEGIVASSMYGKHFFKMFRNAERSIKQDIKLALSTKRVLLIQPPKDSPTGLSTTDYDKLITTYNMGKEEGKRIKEFLK